MQHLDLVGGEGSVKDVEDQVNILIARATTEESTKHVREGGAKLVRIHLRQGGAFAMALAVSLNDFMCMDLFSLGDVWAQLETRREDACREIVHQSGWFEVVVVANRVTHAESTPVSLVPCDLRCLEKILHAPGIPHGRVSGVFNHKASAMFDLMESNLYYKPYHRHEGPTIAEASLLILHV